MTESRFSWMESYRAIADALLIRKMRRDGVQNLYERITGDTGRVAIDPFTFLTAYNRNIVSIDRLGMIQDIIAEFGLDVAEPTDFVGIPTADHEDWQYFDNTPEGSEACWQLFEAAVKLADAQTRDLELAREFCTLFDTVHAQENVTKARLTRTLYYIRPSFYLPFGEKARDYVHSRYGITTPVIMSGMQYLRTLQELAAVTERPFYEIAERSYQAADESWWPSIEDFDPDMSIHQWMDLLSDETLTSAEVLHALRKIVKLGGNATTDELADDRGHDRNYYSTLLRGYARDVASRLGRKSYKGSYWPYLFVGQNADETRNGDYVWRLRGEISQALSELA